MDATVVTRPATPQDAVFAASLAHRAGPEIYNAMLGREKTTALQVLVSVFSRSRALICFENATIAEVDGQPAGLLIAYDKKAEISEGTRYFKAVVKTLPLRKVPLAIIHMLLMRFFVRPIRKTSLYGSVIAVAPEFEGKGVGLALLNEFIRQARTYGYEGIEADVETDNTHALKIYDRFGFERAEQRSTGYLHRLLGFEGYIRIRKAL